MIPLSAYVAVSAVLFITGLLGVLIRRNFIIVLMLLNLKTEERYFHSTYLYFVIPTVLGSLYVLALLFKSPYRGAKGDAPAAAVLREGDTYAIGIKMFSDYLLQFEIVGIFLLGAIIGAIVLAKTPKPIGGRANGDL